MANRGQAPHEEFVPLEAIIAHYHLFSPLGGFNAMFVIVRNTAIENSYAPHLDVYQIVAKQPETVS